MELRHDGGEASVHLFRPRLGDVVRSQTSFDVSHGDFPIERGESGGESGSCVSLDEHAVKRGLGEQIVHCAEDAASQTVEGLVVAHDVEFNVNGNTEDLKDLIEHLTMLTGGDDEWIEFPSALSKFKNNRGHFDRIGASAKNDCDSFFHKWRFSKPTLESQ